MSKVVLDSVVGGFDLSKINGNFQKIQTELNNKVLYRNNPIGEDNTLVTDVDANSVKIYNVPSPTLSTQVVPKSYVDGKSLYTAILWRNVWTTGTLYNINDAVSFNGSSYIALVQHTSTVFATDLSGGKWGVLAQAGSSGAGTGDMLKANNLSDLVDPVAARNNLGLGSAATQTTTSFNTAVQTDAATNKVTPVDGDELPIADSASSFSLKKITILNLKVILKSYFDTLYAVIGGGGSILRSYLAGCTLSTAGASSTMSISAGQATDSTNTVLMSLTALAKTTASWVVGTAVGGLDTGAIANSTWYYFYMIRRPDTQVVDVIFSLNSTTPTLPTNYTQYRYIGAALINGSGQWVKFVQDGDDFMWDTPVLDFNGAGSATAALLTCSVPRKRVKALFNIGVFETGGGTAGVYISDPSVADLVPSAAAAPLTPTWIQISGLSAQINGTTSSYTNTSAQVRHRETAGTSPLTIATLGWIDSRGRNL